MDKITQFKEILEKSRRLVVFTGAGMSTDSGIPDFRSGQGIFMEESGYQVSPEQIISHSFFQANPEVFYEFYFDKMVYPEANPNFGHELIAQLENDLRQVTVVTQNIDSLHQMAGSSHVIEIHGTVHENYCLECGQTYSLEELVLDEQGIPRCPKDQGIVRPNVVLYQEGLNPLNIAQAISAIQEADTLMILGTSLAVYPAASFIQYFQGQHLVAINKTEIPVHYSNALIFQDGISEVFQSVKEQGLIL